MKHNFFVEVGYKTSQRKPDITFNCMVQIDNPEFKGFFRCIKKVVGPRFIAQIPPAYLCNGTIEIVNLAAVGQFD